MDDYVASMKRALIESVNFFGNKNKQERELLVLQDFLSYLPIPIICTDVVPATEEPFDVSYGPYRFQVKEVLSEGRRRGDEYAQALSSITEESKPEDLLEPYHPTNIPLNDALPRVVSELRRHREEKYDEQQSFQRRASNIDVLVYLNLTDTTYSNKKVDFPHEELEKWKSVSLVSNNCAIVLACSDQCNQLLFPHIGHLYVKNVKEII